MAARLLAGVAWIFAASSMVQFRYAPGPRTPAAAFRRDLELLPLLDASEEEQGGWIMVATILDHAARANASHWVSMIEQAAGLAEG